MRNWRKTLNAAKAWRDAAKARDRLRAMPLRVHLEVNDVCNLACPVCSRHNPDIPKDTGHMDVAVVEALRPTFRKALTVGLAGNGEPFLHPRFFDILDIITAEKAVPSVLTNFTLIDEAKARRLVGVGPMILMASIDGGSPEVYETMRAPAKFEETRENLLTLKRVKEATGSIYPAVNFLVTLCRANQNDMSNVIDLAREVGADCVSVQNCYPYSDAARAAMIESPEEIARAIDDARHAAGKHDMRLEYHPMASGLLDRSEGLVLDGDVVKSDKGAAPVALFCPNIWSQLHILVNGDVRVCCFSVRETIGNVLTGPPESIWNHPLLVETRRDMLSGHIPSDCPRCHLLSQWDAANPGAQAKAEFLAALKE